MPSKVDKIRINNTMLDRRRKLTQEQKELIKQTYNTEQTTMTELGNRFGVSRHIISIIVNPQRAENVKQRVKDHWRDYQKSGEEYNSIMREHRKYKQELYIRGEIK